MATIHPSPDTFLTLLPEGKFHIQQVIGTPIYYVQVVNSAMLTSINEIVIKQAHPMIKTTKALADLLNSCAMHPDAARCKQKAKWVVTSSSALHQLTQQNHPQAHFTRCMTDAHRNNSWCTGVQ
eukprot:11555926-Ditylum_brightwellii.AAC.1